MPNDNKVAINSFALMLVQVTNYVGPFLILMILTRRLGFEVYSIFAFALVIVNLANIFTDYGFYLSATERIAQAHNRELVINHILGSVTSIKILLTLVALVAIFLYAELTDKYAQYKELFQFSTLLVFLNALNPYWLFRGIERMFFITVLTVVTKTLSVIGVFFFVIHSEHINRAMLIYTVATLISCLLSYYFIWKIGYRFKLSTIHLKLTAAYGWSYFCSRICAASYTSANALFLGLWGRPEFVGIYTIALEFYRAMQSMFHPFYLSVYPHMAKKKDYKLFFKLCRYVILAAILITPIAAIFGPKIITFIATEDFSAAIKVFYILLLVFVINIVGSLFGYPYFVALGKNHIANNSIFIGFLFHLVTIAVITKLGLLDPITAAWTLVATELLVAMIRLYKARHFYRHDIAVSK